MSLTSNAIVPPYIHATPWRSLVVLLLSRRAFIRRAVSHSMAVNLEAPDLRARHHDGTYPSPGWAASARQQASDATAELCRAVWWSFAILVLVSLAASGVLFLVGKLEPDLPISASKALGAVGAFLGGWATLFALGTPVRTWKGKSLPELVHPKIFISLFVPGLLFALLGQLW